MKAFLFFCFSILAGAFCFSQPFTSLSVTVTDADNHSSLSNTLISIKELNWKVQLTGGDGKAFFDKPVPPGDIHYIISKDGYVGQEGTYYMKQQDKINYLDIKLNQCKVTPGSPSTTPTPTPNPSPTPNSIPTQKVKKNNFTYSLLECRQSGSEVECNLEVKCDNKDETLGIYGTYGSNNVTTLIDAQNGFEYNCDNVTIADKFGKTTVYKPLVAGYPVKVKLVFSGVNSKMNSIARLTIVGGYDESGYYSIEFKNIPVTH